jgi:hypothetical protein
MAENDNLPPLDLTVTKKNDVFIGNADSEVEFPLSHRQGSGRAWKPLAR